MRQQGILPDAAIFCCILKACGNVGAVDKGEEIHNEIFREGLLQSNVILGTTLINMYVKCGELAKAQQVLSGLPVRDAFAWSALIGGYAQQGQGEKALECYEQMKEDGVLPDAVTFLSVLKACGSIGATHKGKEIHDVIIKQELLRKKVSLGGALVDMYAKCGDLRKAEEVLSGLPIRDSISWSALITGYAQVGQGQAALNCFDQMQREGAFPNAITYSSVLKACGTIGAVDKGEQVHHEIVRQGLLKQNVVLGTALIDMYVKCGALAKAQEVLEQLPVGDVVAWSALISGYAERGCGKAALSCFEQMQAKGCLPDAILFSCILNACNHSGLVEEAQNFFSAMTNKFGLKPDVNHFLCMVDLLGRTGHLDKAVAIIHRMPSGKKSVVWPVLMDSCQKWGDVNIGKWVFDNAIQENKADVAAYLCMANIYAAAGMHEHAQTIKAMREANMVRERDFYTQLKDPHR
ncbi:hypothetical protein KP509_24G019600 [Ceratopteris richardii]|nr:hypothetical protein KP509_24G019600 [Ceratopteris richardii]